MQQAKESTSEHEERSKNITQTETQREKRVKRIEQSIQMLWDVISLIYIEWVCQKQKKVLN